MSPPIPWPSLCLSNLSSLCSPLGFDSLLSPPGSAALFFTQLALLHYSGHWSRVAYSEASSDHPIWNGPSNLILTTSWEYFVPLWKSHVSLSSLILKVRSMVVVILYYLFTHVSSVLIVASGSQKAPKRCLFQERVPEVRLVVLALMEDLTSLFSAWNTAATRHSNYTKFAHMA